MNKDSFAETVSEKILKKLTEQCDIQKQMLDELKQIKTVLLNNVFKKGFFTKNFFILITNHNINY